VHNKNNAFYFQDAGSRNFIFPVATLATGTVAPGNSHKGQITSAPRKYRFVLLKRITTNITQQLNQQMHFIS
jgi:hypothetical protein